MPIVEAHDDLCPVATLFLFRVLFPTKEKKDKKAPDYPGNIDLGNDTELPLHGRKVNTDQGSFISLSSGETQLSQRKSGQHADSNHDSSFEDDSTNISFWFTHRLFIYKAFSLYIQTPIPTGWAFFHR